MHVVAAGRIAAMQEGENTSYPDALLLLPNPTAHNVLLRYSLADTKAAAEVVVTDALGHRVGRWTLDPFGTEQELPSDQWVPGVYVVTVQQQGRMIGMQRLAVVQ